MEWQLIFFTGTTDESFADAMVVRTSVFVHEQKVPMELEKDEFDTIATHVVIKVAGAVVGTGRYFTDPDNIVVARLGRVAVLPQFRGQGWGRKIIEGLLGHIKEHDSFKKVLLHAQCSVMGVYESFGFVSMGEEFMEAGIRHREMILLF